MKQQRIFVCTNLRQATGQPSCGARGGARLLSQLQEGVIDRQLAVQVQSSVCFGHCEQGPNVKVIGKPLLHGFDEDQIEALLDSLV